jgi:hypothetical protein
MKEKLVAILLTFLTAIYSFIAPIQGILLLVGVAIIFDTIAGIYCSKKLGDPILSRKLFRLAIKTFVYGGAVIIFYSMDVLLLKDIIGYFLSIPLLLTKAVATTFIFIELYSVDEKIRMVNANKGIWFYFKRLITGVKSIKQKIDKINEK